MLPMRVVVHYQQRHWKMQTHATRSALRGRPLLANNRPCRLVRGIQAVKGVLA
jgi:hypothetical protein